MDLSAAAKGLDSMMDNSEAIAVIHGLGGHRLLMNPLCRRLQKNGFRVVNWGYRSLWKNISTHALAFRHAVLRLENDQRVPRYHIVAHSMGAIVTRVMLADFRPSKLARIVMLCPPNRGSHVATMYAPLFGRITTTLTEIKDSADSFVNTLTDQIDDRYEVGIIQARNDLVVAKENTLLSEAKATIMIPGLHTSVLFRTQTARLVAGFLTNGVFEPVTR